MVGLTGVTDNLGNTFVMAKMMTSKFPMLVILTEVAAQLRVRDLEPGLHWAPREQNEEADALTNGQFHAFNSKLQIPVIVEELVWLVLPAMLSASEAIYEDIARAKVSAPARGKVSHVRVRPADKLRVRDPW